MSEGISADTKIGVVSLTVSSLERSLDFYQNKMGLVLLRREEGKAWLGSGDKVWLELVEVPGARKPAKTTGLYHYAVLLPSRLELAQALRRLALTEAPIEGAADHGVSEAIYLHDPDGTGIEIYRDRPTEEWPRDDQGRIDMGTDPLDLDNLLGELEGLPEEWAGMAPGTQVGHVHLHVSNLAKAEVFYTGTLGFKVMQRYGAQASFLSAGGYHHHIGINTWNGTGAPPPPPNSAGLRSYEILVPTQAEVDRIAAQLKTSSIPFEPRDSAIAFADPAGNGIVVRVL